MDYINKQDILNAYRVLSSISPDPNLQGATQKVSAIRYFIALDMFCNKKGISECSSREKNDKELFESFVGQICSVREKFYTPNFYYPLKYHNGDYNVGSNFYSAGQVKASLINPTNRFDYPKRGNSPLFRIRDGILIKDSGLYQNINSYLETDKVKAALVIWINRDVAILQESSVFARLQNTLKQIVSSEMINLLMPDTENYHQEIEKLIKSPFSTSPSLLTDEDIAGLFPSSIMKVSYHSNNLPHQVIYYGAPGTGKSYKIKEYLESNDVPKENIFRTTFHPDSDYATFVGAYKPAIEKQYRYTDAGVKTKYYEDDDLAQAKKNEPIVDKTIGYHFVPQVFLNAYVRAYQTDEDVFLIIEEINRGNCAQIFGDLFQLLDRNAEGESSYTIKADTDLKAYLKETLGTENDGIKDGELHLPANLFILATMNTSDQSLFPIDSAFKRRWDWEYEPIKYKNKKWKIVVGSKEYSWVSFQEEINKRIFDTTHSEDKMLGDYFVNPHDSIITEKMLLNKVLFYLWNDVCKDGEGDIFMTSETGEVSFSELYGAEGQTKLIQMLETLGIELFSDTTNETGIEDNQDGDPNPSKDYTKYSINGGIPVAKRMAAATLVKQYIASHPALTATEVVNNWKALGTFVSHFIETQAEYELRRDIEPRVEIIDCNGEKIYVSTNGWGGKVIINNLISAIPAEWNLKVEKVN